MRPSFTRRSHARLLFPSYLIQKALRHQLQIFKLLQIYIDFEHGQHTRFSTWIEEAKPKLASRP